MKKTADKKSIVTISDIVFAAVFAAVSVALFIFMSLGGGNTVIITLGGETLAALPLQNDTVYEIKGEYTNKVVIENGEVWVEETDCPNHICEKSGKISRAGQTIVCAPNRAVITIKGEGDLDAVSG